MGIRLTNAEQAAIIEALESTTEDVWERVEQQRLLQMAANIRRDRLLARIPSWSASDEVF